MQVMGGNCGGIIASYVYLTRDSPRYVVILSCVSSISILTAIRFIKGHSLLIGIVGMAFFLTLFMTTYLRFENARRDKVAIERGEKIFTEEEILAHMELADNAPGFRYTV
jgi:CHASE2 domain-containing sensor protein